jgi:hypothetical protein
MLWWLNYLGVIPFILLHATIHMSIQVHSQVMLPPTHSHDYVNQRLIGDRLFSSPPHF